MKSIALSSSKFASKPNNWSFKFSMPFIGIPREWAFTKYMSGLTIFKSNFFIVRYNFSNEDNILAPNFLFLGSKKRGLSLNFIVLPVLF